MSWLIQFGIYAIGFIVIPTLALAIKMLIDDRRNK